MGQRRSMSAEQRQAAVALFASGHGRDAVATQLGVTRGAVRALQNRWRIWGDAALGTKPTKQTCSGEFKLAVVQRVLAGETKIALAQEFDLSSPQLIATWLRIYRAEGADGLRPKPIGRPPHGPEAPEGDAREVARLQREIERLQAEVAYLGKLQALMARKRP